jgi:ribonuclease HI
MAKFSVYIGSRYHPRNPGDFGCWAGVYRSMDGVSKSKIFVCQHNGHITNNRMQMMAFLTVLENMNNGDEIHIYSSYVIKLFGMSVDQKLKHSKNADLLEKISLLLKGKNITPHWERESTTLFSKLAVHLANMYFKTNSPEVFWYYKNAPIGLNYYIRKIMDDVFKITVPSLKGVSAYVK